MKKILQPVNASISQYFGNVLYWNGVSVYGPAGHPGIDFACNTGSNIRACFDGQIVNAVDRGDGYGNLVIIYHENSPIGECFSLYGHNSQFRCQLGDGVRTGDIIALSGGMPGTQGAGISNGPHCHFGIQKNGRNIDPLDFLTLNIDEVFMALTREMIRKASLAVLREEPQEERYQHYLAQEWMSEAEMYYDMAESKQHTDYYNDAIRYRTGTAPSYEQVTETLYRKK